jgi:hypothetical protein
MKSAAAAAPPRSLPPLLLVAPPATLLAPLARLAPTGLSLAELARRLAWLLLLPVLPLTRLLPPSWLRGAGGCVEQPLLVGRAPLMLPLRLVLPMLLRWPALAAVVRRAEGTRWPPGRLPLRLAARLTTDRPACAAQGVVQRSAFTRRCRAAWHGCVARLSAPPTTRT